ncbi:MAG TPA: hypothetical protein VGM38_07555 [Pseudolysinimonas sp.]|jgi:hypothetical protein
MIRGNRSTLAVYSQLRTAAEMTAVLDLEPHESNEVGEPTRAALAGRDLKPEAMAYQRAHWSFTADESLVDPEDETGFSSLRVLLDVFRDRANAISSLRPDCETVIWWSGDSDSSQGGFVIPADLLADIALLGCDLYGTAYLIDEDDE